MKHAFVLTACSALALVPTPFAGGVGTDLPHVQLSVSPARITLVAAGARRIRLRNLGTERVVVDVMRRPADRAWLHIVPARLQLRSGATGTLTLRVTPRPHAEPGDHRTLVLLATRPLREGRVNVQVRLGLRVSMRVPGRVVRRLVLGRLHVQRKRHTWLLLVSVANRGNVTVHLRGQVTATLLRRGRRIAHVRPRSHRAVAPGARGVVALRFGGRLRGAVTAVVQVRLGGGNPIVERRYTIRL